MGRNSGSKVNSDEAAFLYRSGQTLTQIGIRYGVSRERVRQILKRDHDITKDDKPNRFKPDQESRILRLYEEGWPVTYIAESLGVWNWVISGFLLDRGIKPRKNGFKHGPAAEREKISEDMKPMLSADYESGMSTTEVARKYGIAQNRAWVIIAEQGKNRPKLKFTPEVVAECVRLRKDGYTYERIASTVSNSDLCPYPISQQGIQLAFKMNGIESPRFRRKKDERDDTGRIQGTETPGTASGDTER